MKPSLLIDTLTARIQAGIKRPVFIKGPPGIGKTQIVQQVAKDLGQGFKMIHPPTMLDEDFGIGLPSADRTSINFIVSKDKFPLADDPDCPDEGILLVDELPQASQNGQKILANVFQERVLHEARLKPGWAFIATGNRVADRAGASRLLSHLSGRVTDYDLDVDMNDWCQWYLAQPNCRVEVVSFIRFREAAGNPMLSNFDPQQDKSPSPRAWVEGVAASLGNVPAEAEFETFKGDVGEGPASEFVGFLRIFRQIPDPDMVLMDPENAPVPADTATLYALAGAIGRRSTRDNFERVMTYAQRMPPELTVLTVLDAKQNDAGIVESRAFIQWASGPGARLLGAVRP